MKQFFFVLIFTSIFIQVTIAQFAVGHRSINFRDPARTGGFSINGGTTFPTGSTGRNIGTEIYYPATTAGDNTPVANGRFPVVVFAHGFQMTWDSYQSLYDSLVREGYIVAAPRTEGSLLPSHSNFGQDLAIVLNYCLTFDTVATSPFFGKVWQRGAISGHSMGGGSTFLADQYNSRATCYFTMAPANTNPPSIAAAANITKPMCIMGGTRDCVASVADHQQPMYNALPAASCKQLLVVTDARHCSFSDNTSFQCSFGEGSTGCGSSPLSTAAQLAIIRSAMIPYFNYFLKGICSEWARFQTNINTNPAIAVTQSCTMNVPANETISGNTEFCNGSSTTLQAQPTGFTYQWNNNSNTSSITVSQAGNYGVTISNVYCSVTAGPVTITEKFAPTTPTGLASVNEVCAGATGATFSVTNDPAASTYNWTLPQGWNITNGAGTNSITTDAGNSGTIEVTAQNNCGTSTAAQQSVSIVPTQLSTPSAITGSNNPCSGTSTTYQIPAVNGATTYNWVFPQGWSIPQSPDSNVVVVVPGNINGVISVTASNACASTAAVTINVLTSQAPAISGNIQGPATICEGSGLGTYYAINQVSNADTYTWTIPQDWSFLGTSNTFAPIINVNSSGTIQVTATNICGSSSAVSLSVNVVDTPQAQLTQTGNTLTAQPAAQGLQYTWYYNGQVIPNQTGSTYEPQQNGLYTVVITDAQNCSGSTTANFVFSSVLDENLQRLKVYPNPASGLVVIEGASLNGGLLQLFDVTGRIVKTQQATANKIVMSVSDVTPGIYLLSTGNTNTTLVIE